MKFHTKNVLMKILILTLSFVSIFSNGCIDVIITKSSTYLSTPWHVHFKSKKPDEVKFTMLGDTIDKFASTNDKGVLFFENDGVSPIPSNDILSKLKLDSKFELMEKNNMKSMELSYQLSLIRKGIHMECRMYLFNGKKNAVISDIDGTVTKSNIKGIITSVFNLKDGYFHQGICKLLRTFIDKYDLNVVLLSARSIDLFELTKQHMDRLIEEIDGVTYDCTKLPVLVNHESLFKALKTEIIDKPIEFKKLAIRDVQNILENKSKSIKMALGNNIADMTAYAGVSIPFMSLINTESKLVIYKDVNGKPELNTTETDQMTYLELIPKLPSLITSEMVNMKKKRKLK